MAPICSRLEPTQVMCAMAVMLACCWIWITSSTVLRRVEPPAPQVTETKAGSSRLSSAIVSNRER